MTMKIHRLRLDSRIMARGISAVIIISLLLSRVRINRRRMTSISESGPGIPRKFQGSPGKDNETATALFGNHGRELALFAVGQENAGFF